MDRDCCSCCCCCSFFTLLASGAFMATLLAGVFVRRKGYYSIVCELFGIRDG